MSLTFRILLIVAIVSLSSVGANAEEGAVGHYFPGTLSSLFDLLPDKCDSPVRTSECKNVGALAYDNESLYYHGSNIHLSSNATSYSNASVFLYQAPWGLFGGQYAAALAVPYTFLKVHAPVRNSKGMFVLSKDTENGFGDVEMIPLLMGWTQTDEDPSKLTHLWKYQTAFGIYAPSGNYQSGNAGNIGRNYWTFEPSGAVSYLRYPTEKSKNAYEFTTAVGFDFNTKNNTTHYQSGDQFHLDGTVAMYRPMFGKGCTEDPYFYGCLNLGIGASGFFYQQITRDSGSGAFQGSFEGMTTGIGPSFSGLYRTKTLDIGSEVKWLPELSVSNRLQGNYIWLKIVVTWGTSSEVPRTAQNAQPLTASQNAIPTRVRRAAALTAF
jgi:hypothetical protein